MPVNLTYPGVYVQEVPSSVRTIMAVPTATAAFVGVATRGPVDKAVHITSWADFERTFGGLSPTSRMSYAVYHFYLNGGAEAEVVRVDRADAVAATIALGDSGPVLTAASSGAWGNRLRARVDYDVNPEAAEGTLYNLTVRDSGTGAEERYANVSTDEGSPQYLGKLLRTSSLVKLDGDATTRPAANGPAVGSDPFADPPAAAAEGEGGGEGGGTPVAPPFYAADDAGADGVADPDFAGDADAKTGVHALVDTDIFNLLVIPSNDPAADPDPAVLTAALALCTARRAILLVDPPVGWTDITTAAAGATTPPVSGSHAKNAALFFPNIVVADPLEKSALKPFPPSGAMAGVIARTDAQRGAWKAPAGIDASVNGAQDVAVRLTDLENGRLNPLGVNCIRRFPVIGTVAWGARTLRGADALADQWKYLPVRRLALFIEESLYRGTKWVVFEPNDEPLWASIRLNVGAFMNSLFRQGAFQGRTAQEAYLVKCDKENNPQNDIDRGIVNILVGFAPLKPAEFVLLHIQQLSPEPQA